MTEYAASLSKASACNPAHTGSKGAALARMVSEKVPVPAGFAVTTSAFHTVAESLAADLHILSDSGSTSENALREASGHVRRAILESDFPRGTIAQSRAEWKKIGSPAVSVRSSSTAEDLADASFAGQYESYLNVTSFGEILEKIKLVWASLHSPHAIGYRRRHGMSHSDALMAVVVQTQLTPDASGVLFTRDPVTGKNQIVISAARGLGEGVVAGTAEVDRFVLRPKTGALLSSDISTKKTRVITSKSGGIQTVTVPVRDQKKPALTSRQLTQLAKIGKTLARYFGKPQDIEFAAEDGRVQILQSRPMTAVEAAIKPETPWSRGVDRRYTWSRRGGPYYRLEEDTAVIRLKHLKTCYDKTGSSMAANHVGFVTHGVIYTRAKEVGERTLKKRHQLQTERVDISLAKGKSYFEDVLQALVEDRLNALKKQRASIRSLLDRVHYVEASVETTGYVQGNLHWRQGKPGGRGNWHKEFNEITGEPEHRANVFLQAIPNQMTLLIDRIVELARIAKSDRELKRIFLDRDFDALSSPEIERRQKTKRFNTRFRAMMRKYGQRSGHGYGTGSGFATPTWNIDHTLPFEFIAVYVELDLAKLERQEKRALKQRLQAGTRTRRKLARDPEKLTRFNEALLNAEMGVRFLEDHNYYMEQCTIGTMRESIYSLGMDLVKRGQIDHPDDVFHFSLAELKRIAKKKTIADLRPVVVERTEERERWKRMRPPATLGKKPKKAKPGQAEKGPVAGLDGDIIRGASVSSGQVTGRAVVALPNRERPRVHPGDILVAPNVGPDWTPIFATIGGLVLDSGSLGQHAALVAREYQIPSVMHTKEASRLIKNGQRITVDGDAGIIELNPKV
jgi:phosphoenolpyruvate synthase/pyruvate phosphate dikinase